MEAIFEVGREYTRSQLLEAVGSKQRQSGIIWGPADPSCVIITSGGRHSKSAGYGDAKNADGTWNYFGQGEKGDQNPVSPANRLLIEGQRSVLLFTTRHPTLREVQVQGGYSSFYKYEGAFLVSSWEFFTPEAGKRSGDKLLLFHLVPVKEVFAHEADDDIEYLSGENLALKPLREKLLVGEHRPIRGYLATKEFRKGSAQIRAYAKLRAGGMCENCNKAAPFKDKSGEPFLEVHHINRLADDGPDSPRNVAAICPNCHREAHLGRDTLGFRERLSQKIGEKEACLDKQIDSSHAAEENSE
jgi:5-methylcytosine-specific restriction protein A